MNDSSVIVEVESLSFRYGARTALRDVSFSVDRGTMFALLGPNGGGKTTLFKILTTLLSPLTGRARIADADVVAQQRRVRERIGIVFQKPSLDGKLTVLENLQTQGHLYGLSGPPLTQRCRDVLERFNLADRTHDRAEKLSGGLQRRVELAKSLLHRPEVLILDEPGTGLDPAARSAFLAHLADLRARDGITCLLTSHLMDEAERCDRIGFLDQGRLLALDTPKALKQTIGGDILTVTTDDPEQLARRIRERFDAAVDVVDRAVRIERKNGHEFVPHLVAAFPGEIESVTVGKPTLEDVFIHLTGRRFSDDDADDKHGRDGR